MAYNDIPFLSAPASPVVPTDDQGITNVHTPCAGCGYDLFTLHIDALCPECGMRVRKALAGSYMVFSDPAWVSRLASGMDLLLKGMLTYFGVCMLAFASAGTDFLIGELISGALILCTGFACIVGIWRLTSWGPTGRTRRWRPLLLGLLLRIIAVLALVSLATILAAPALHWEIAPLLGYGALIHFVTVILVFPYAGILLARVPAEHLVKSCRRTMWGLLVLPAMTTASFAIGTLLANATGSVYRSFEIKQTTGIIGIFPILAFMLLVAYALFLLGQIGAALRAAATAAEAQQSVSRITIPVTQESD